MGGSNESGSRTAISAPINYTIHFSALHCIAMDCNALHFTGLFALPGNALSSTALHCTTLHCTALNCTTLHCTALHCTALYFPALQSFIVLNIIPIFSLANICVNSDVKQKWHILQFSTRDPLYIPQQEGGQGIQSKGSHQKKSVFLSDIVQKAGGFNRNPKVLRQFCFPLV